MNCLVVEFDEVDSKEGYCGNFGTIPKLELNKIHYSKTFDIIIYIIFLEFDHLISCSDYNKLKLYLYFSDSINGAEYL